MTQRGKTAVRPRSFRIETVRGQPVHVGERTLIPVARIVSFGRARGTIGADRIGGWGAGFAWVTPVAVVEETPEGERCTPIADETAAALRGLLGAAVAITLFFTAVRWLVRRRRAARAVA
jgi:uncharacterized spore protein YtfJ